MARARVVHCKKSPYDVYVGRPSKWGNPYGVDAADDMFRAQSKKEAVSLYEAWLLQQPELVASLHELRGKVLGCWCSPGQPCHGNVLVRLAEGDE